MLEIYRVALELILVFETIFNFIYSTQYLIVLPYDGDL